MATNDFMPFAADPAANVMLQTDYIAGGFTPRILGFQTGTAISNQLNKVWRQSSLIAAMVSQFTVDETGADMLDDGSTAGQATLLTNFKNAIHAASGAGLAGNYLPLAGGTLSGALNITCGATQLAINATTGQDASFGISRNPGQQAQIFAQSNASLRWMVVLASLETESGGNAGSNFGIARYNDTGAFLDEPISISRRTGVVNFSQPPQVNGGFLPYVPISGGRMTGFLGSPGIQFNYGGYAHSHQFFWDGTWEWAVVDGTAVYAIASVNWVQSVAAGYLPLTGGTLQNPGNLDIEGSMWVTGGVLFRSSVAFANAGDFANFQSGGNRFRQWASYWYDYWNGSSGARSWVNYNGTSMTMDPGTASLTSSGNFIAYGGHFVGLNNGAVTVQSGSTSQGMWADPSGLWFGWSGTDGNPTRGLALLGNDGTYTVWNGIVTYGSMQASGQVTAGGRFYGTDRLIIASGYPSITTWATNLGVAYGAIATSYGPNAYGSSSYSIGLAGGDGSIYNVALVLTDAGWLFVSGHVGTPSDRRLKTDIEPAQFDSLDAIRRIDMHSYKMKGVAVPVGMIADEIKRVLPDAIVPGIDDMDYMDHTALLCHAFKAISQLADLIDQLRRSHV
jgi:hypothetical protein